MAPKQDCDEAVVLPYAVLQERSGYSSSVSLLQRSVTVMSLLVTKVREYQLQHTRLQTSFSSKSGCVGGAATSLCVLSRSLSLALTSVLLQGLVLKRGPSPPLYTPATAHTTSSYAPRFTSFFHLFRVERNVRRARIGPGDGKLLITTSPADQSELATPLTSNLRPMSDKLSVHSLLRSENLVFCRRSDVIVPKQRGR